MDFLIVLLIFNVIGCGVLMRSRNKTIKTIGNILGAIGLIFCIYVGYKLGGIVGAIIGFFIMAVIIGSGMQENDKIEANEYLANKNREAKEEK